LELPAAQEAAISDLSGRFFAPRTKLMAALLAVSIAQLLHRLPLGLGSAGVVVSRVLHSGEELAQEM
jgi:hypothetical protein